MGDYAGDRASILEIVDNGCGCCRQHRLSTGREKIQSGLSSVL
jgi:hypothetical protein